MEYNGILLKNILTINKILTIHHFEHAGSLTFSGGSHAFWELIYVDKGSADLTMNETHTVLNKGQIAFLQPGEFHKAKMTGDSSTVITIAFHCNNETMNFFKRRIEQTDELEKDLLANIVIEARQAFSSSLDNPYSSKMIRNNKEEFGAEQLIKLYLEQLLIHLIRRCSVSHSSPQVPLNTLLNSAKPKNETELFDYIVRYMELHLSTKITIEQICRDNTMARSQLQKLFHKKSGCGIIEHFSRMKIAAAKEMIRTGRMNFTQIAEQLGYTSIHYFSRQFKKITCMTPSEYAASVNSIIENK